MLPTAMMTSRNFSSHTNFLAKTLGSTPAFAKCLLQSVEGKLLETKVIKEKAGGTTVVNLEFRPASNLIKKVGKHGGRVGKR